jgi:membrane protein DedA with SNARE-associated domain
VVLSTLVVPLPEEVALLGAGFLAQRNDVSLAGAFLACWLAVVLGDALTFYAGRVFLQRLLKSRLGRRMVRPAQRRWAESFVARQGWRAILVGRFLVALRGPVYLAIGASGYGRARFLLLNSSVALLEAGLVFGLGYTFGESFALAGKVRWIDAAVVASLLIGFLIPWLFGRWLKKRPEREPTHTTQ